MRAANLFARGASQADVARELGVSRQSASDWYATWRTGGKRALRGAGRAGRLPKLSESDLAKVARALEAGPKANGFATDMWSLARVAAVIESVTGISYSTTQTWWILRERLHWSRQRPARRAIERNEDAIRAWVKNRWPRVKKTPDAEGPGSSSKTSPASHCCPR